MSHSSATAPDGMASGAVDVGFGGFGELSRADGDTFGDSIALPLWSDEFGVALGLVIALPLWSDEPGVELELRGDSIIALPL